MWKLIDEFKEELRTISKTPRTFVVGFLALAVLIGWGEYFVFRELLNLKDDTIRTLQGNRGDAKQSVPTQGSSTGSATTFGNHSPANSGTIGTLNSPTTTERKQ